MYHFNNWRQTIGCTGRCCNNSVQLRVEQVIINTHDTVENPILFHRCCHHHTLYPLIQVRLQRLSAFELTARLNHEITVRPVGLTECFFACAWNLYRTDQHRFTLMKRFVLPAPMHRVEVKKMGKGSSVTGRVVNLYNLNILCVINCAHCEAPHTTKTVDTHSYCHLLSPQNRRLTLATSHSSAAL